MSGWQEAVLRHAIDPIQQFAYVKGKNATDIALVIEAMDLLHSEEYDGFCLVSSDSDFASLALRIRKQGLKVYGFGKSTAVISFRQACDEFFEVEKLLAKQNAKPTPKTQNTQPKSTNDTNATTKYTTAQLRQDTKLVSTLRQIIANHPKTDQEGWCPLINVAKELNKNLQIHSTKYGYSKPSQLIQATNLFVFKKQDGTTYIKYNNAKSKAVISNKPTAEQNTTAPTTQTKNQNHQSNPAEPASTQTQPQTQPETSSNILSGKIKLLIDTPQPLDMALWRLTKNKKVRHDDDVIFYGQTHTKDGLIDLDITQDNRHSFSCHLDGQPDDICQIILTASRTDEAQTTNLPIAVCALQDDKSIFITREVLKEERAKSIMLIQLRRKNNGWQIVPHSQVTGRTLHQLCQLFGVEVDE